MTYRINEIFYSIQGEGYWTGRPAVFVRFSGCNLWTGVEADRWKALCQFCDTDFINYQEFSLAQLRDEILLRWPGGGDPMVVFTGGEPLLQLDDALVDAAQRDGFYVALETNGTKPLTVPVDWVCVSPKTRTVRIDSGDELKMVYPQNQIPPELFTGLDFQHFWLSPMDGRSIAENTAAAYSYCLANPQWRLSIQTHKVIGVR